MRFDERLLAAAQEPFLRRLAQALLRTDADAEDALQETCVAALERPPPDRRNPGGWLAAVLRNVARKSGRSEARRSARERRASRPEAAPSALEAAARAEVVRAVEAAVGALDPGSREVLLLRHHEGLPPRAIADRLGLAPEAVKSRLRRAHDRVRERLDSDGRGPERWRASLGAWLLEGSPQAPLATAGVGPAVVAAGVLGLAAAGTVLAISWTGRSPTPVPPTGVVAANEAGGAPALLARAPGPVEVSPTGDDAPAAAAESTPSAEEPSAADVEGEGLRLTPVDVVEVPLLGLASGDDVVGTIEPLASDSPHRSIRGTTLREGAVRFDGVSKGVWRMRLRGPGATERSSEPLVVPWIPEGNYVRCAVFGAASLEGRAYDREGRTVPGRAVTLTVAEHWTDGGSFGRLRATSDADGVYRFEAVHSGGYLVTVAVGPEDAPAEDASADRRVARVTLAPGEARSMDLGRPSAEPRWRGRVRLSSGTRHAAAPGERASFRLTAETGEETVVPFDAEGRFDQRVPSGRHRLEVRLVEGTSVQEIETSDGTFDRDVVLPGVRVSGTVLDARTRRPFVDPDRPVVRVLGGGADPARAPSSLGPSVVPGQDGSFRFDGVAPGPRHVLVHGRGDGGRWDRLAASVEVEVPVDRDVSDLVIEVPPR